VLNFMLIMTGMQNVYSCILEPLLFVHSRNSGKFPKTAWRAVHSARRHMHFLTCCGFLKRNRLAAPSLAARRHMAILGFF